MTACFDRRGKYILAGNAKGRLNVIKLEEDGQTSIVSAFRVSNLGIKQIESAKDCFLVNTADRVIRVYNMKDAIELKGNSELEPVQKLQDLVNKTMWKKCCFSGGSEADYVCAGSARQHSICIWERTDGSLKKILHGTKGETLLDVVVSWILHLCDAFGRPLHRFRSSQIPFLFTFNPDLQTVASDQADNCKHFEWRSFNMGSGKSRFRKN